MHKKLFLLLLLCLPTETILRAQTYRLEHLYKDTSPRFYFSCWKAEDKSEPTLFSLWSRTAYGENINVKFTEYETEEYLLTTIEGTRMKCDRENGRRKSVLIYNKTNHLTYELTEK